MYLLTLAYFFFYDKIEAENVSSTSINQGKAFMRKEIYNFIEPSIEASRLSKVYDFIMIIAIVASLIPLAFKDSIPLFDTIEQIALVIFLFDYFLRLITADYKLPHLGKRAFLAYPFTPMAIIDLLSILPSLSLVSSGFRLLRLLRLLRMMRLFRVFRLLRYSKSIKHITNVLKKQKASLITVGCMAVGYILLLALIIFNVEPDTFHNFFEAVYWATISLTTVGYGDIYPVTVGGRIITMISALAGIAVVALPAGIIISGYLEELNSNKSEKDTPKEAETTDPKTSVVSEADQNHR